MEFGNNYSFPNHDRDAVFISFTDARLSGKLETVEAADNLFDGEVAAWAHKQTRLKGDFIEPRQMYIEWTDNVPHRVAWVEHTGINHLNNEPFHLHHVVCDCAYYKELDLVNRNLLLECEILHNAVLERTDFVAREHHIREIVTSFDGTLADDFQKNDELNDLLILTIETILNFDRNHPEQWLGNIVSGEHDVQLLSKIVGQSEDTVRLCADILRFQDKVEIAGDTLRLAA